jgi:hypothetical protein
VRNMGVIEGNQPVSDNDWESITKGGDTAIKKWIDAQIIGRSCNVVLIGANTAGRKWISYEIEKAWNDGKGVVGIFIHNLKDVNEKQASKGSNPFDSLSVNGKKLSSIVKAYDPPYSTSTSVYAHIKNNIDAWVQEAIDIRKKY